MSEQLTLGMVLKSQYTFDRFVVGDNQELLFMLQRMDQHPIDKGMYVWGESGAGCTHLLQACAHAHSAQGKTVMYLSAATADPACLDSVAHLSLIVLDDVAAIAGNDVWERALYRLYNQLSEGMRLLVAGRFSVADLPVVLPDLRSRLSALAGYQVHGLSDANKQLVLKARAKDRGMRLSDQVLDYLFAHYDRSMDKQLAMLAKLDHISLVQKRAITIPLIKSVLPLKKCS